MNFPLLITGERVQASAVRSEPAQYNEYFYEGYSRQTQMRSGLDLRYWQLVYTNLTPEEAMSLRAFFEALPAGGTFAFTDPWTGEEFAECRLAEPSLDLSCDKDNRYRAELEVEYAG